MKKYKRTKRRIDIKKKIPKWLIRLVLILFAIWVYGEVRNWLYSKQEVHLALTCIVIDKKPAIGDPWKPPSLIPESVTPKEWDMALLFYKNGYDENDPRYLETVNSVEYSQDVLTSKSWLNIYERMLEVTPERYFIHLTADKTDSYWFVLALDRKTLNMISYPVIKEVVNFATIESQYECQKTEPSKVFDAVKKSQEDRYSENQI